MEHPETQALDDYDALCKRDRRETRLVMRLPNAARPPQAVRDEQAANALRMRALYEDLRTETSR